MAPRLKCLPSGLPTIDTRIAQPPPKRADPFYLSKPWRQLMRQLVSSRGDACQECGRSGVRLFGDHIHELKDGGSQLDPSNIRLLCGSCHTKKTAKARAVRMAQRHAR